MSKFTIVRQPVLPVARTIKANWTIEDIVDRPMSDFVELSVTNLKGVNWYLVALYDYHMVDWLYEQPMSSWGHQTQEDGTPTNHYILHEELYTLFTLRWAK